MYVQQKTVVNMYLFCLGCLHDEALERYMKLSKKELSKLEAKVGVALNILCSHI